MPLLQVASFAKGRWRERDPSKTESTCADKGFLEALHKELAQIDPPSAAHALSHEKRASACFGIITKPVTMTEHDEEAKLPPRYDAVYIGLSFEDLCRSAVARSTGV